MPQSMNVSVALSFVDRFTEPVRLAQERLQELTRGVQAFNRAVGGTGASSPFTQLRRDIQSIVAEVRNLVGQFNRLDRAISGTGAGGNFAQRQVADMQRLIQLQSQAIANNRTLAQGPPGGGGLFRGGPPPRFGGGGQLDPFGHSGFNPNASIIDRLQYMGVNTLQQSLATGALDRDRVRTVLDMLARPRVSPTDPNTLLPGVIRPEDVATAERVAAELSQGYRILSRAHPRYLPRDGDAVPECGGCVQALTRAAQCPRDERADGLYADQARAGMASLVRAIGLSGRLISNQSGRLSLVDPNDPNSEIEAAEFLRLYTRARMIGGRDVTADQVFQAVKYLKTTGQTLDLAGLLTTFIAMPDIRGSTFGNQLNQLRSHWRSHASRPAGRRTGWPRTYY